MLETYKKLIKLKQAKAKKKQVEYVIRNNKNLNDPFRYTSYPRTFGIKYNSRSNIIH